MHDYAVEEMRFLLHLLDDTRASVGEKRKQKEHV